MRPIKEASVSFGTPITQVNSTNSRNLDIVESTPKKKKEWDNSNFFFTKLGRR